jgi:oxygen-independent coproporphyrinogen-3 oxidase
VRSGGIDEAHFQATYLRELEHWARTLPGRHVGSIFFGGGTPSLMSASLVGDILDAISRAWPIEADAEVTLEANPSSVEASRFRGYRSAGVNRVSLGVQALDDKALKWLGRLHSAAEAKAGIDVARETFARFSFDLIYARPGQTPAEWARELGEAITLAGEHLSLYQLTIEPGTPFAELHARGRLLMPESEHALALYEITQDATERAGLPAYEISNHAVPGAECRHNLLYWRYGEYVGIGPGAHGRVQLGEVRHATATERNPERWAAQVTGEGHGLTQCEALSAFEQAEEMLLMGLRLNSGLDLDRLMAVSRHTLRVGAIDELEGLGLLERATAGNGIRASRAGRCVLNEVVLRLASALEAIQEPHKEMAIVGR